MRIKLPGPDPGQEPQGLARVRLQKADGSFRESELIPVAAAQGLHARCFSAIHDRGSGLPGFVAIGAPTYGLPGGWAIGDYTGVSLVE